MRNLLGLCAAAAMAASVGAYAFGVAPSAQSGSQAAALAEEFRGITVDGEIVADLFRLRATGVSTAPVVVAAASFLDTLGSGQRNDTMFAVDDIEWRRWNNVHRYDRRGVSFGDVGVTTCGRLRASRCQPIGERAAQGARHHASEHDDCRAGQ